MDPNATLADIAYCIKNQEWDDAAHLCEQLHDWLESGGFEPDWSSEPKAYQYFIRAGAKS